MWSINRCFDYQEVTYLFIYFSIHDVAVPIAKLIPFLSGLVYKLGSDAPNPLVQVRL